MTFLEHTEYNLKCKMCAKFVVLATTGIIFRGNSHHSDRIFKIQKRMIRIITNTGRQDSCHQLYKQLQILPLSSQYIFSLLVLSTRTEVYFCLILKFII